MSRNRNTRVAGLYVHVPFCKRKCIYCDFYSVGGEKSYRAFIESLVSEYRQREHEIADADSLTLYIGGGTPSLLPPEEIGRIRSWITKPVDEFTIEVNPDDITVEMAEKWREAGVDRISMGVQSLDDEELKNIGRRHDSFRAREAYKILNERFDNISLDLMFGLPGQTLESLKRTVKGIIAMRPKHISAYSLMYEERTALTRMRDNGMVVETPEDESVKMFEMINSMLAAAGYERYEISNYALPGYRSRHNSNYWRGLPYLGLGPSAHSYDGSRIRRMNPADLRGYLQHFGGKAFAEILPEFTNTIFEEAENFYEEEHLTEEELREEMIMTRLRTYEGLDMEEYAARFGSFERWHLNKKAGSFLATGDLLFAGSYLRLSDTGIMISDEIISSLF